MTNFSARSSANGKGKGSYPKITAHSHIDYMLI